VCHPEGCPGCSRGSQRGPVRVPALRLDPSADCPAGVRAAVTLSRTRRGPVVLRRAAPLEAAGSWDGWGSVVKRSGEAGEGSGEQVL